jgi:molybdate transport system ATP-binding protein
MSRALEIRTATPLREFSLEAELSIEAGECLALVGPSGAGKSSLLRIVAGLLSPSFGTVALDGDRWLDTEDRIDVPPERRGCGLVFQDYALFPGMSAWRNVAYGIDAARRERRRRAIEMLERFGVGKAADSRPEELSGGERQRVALARALALEPRTLLLDEPLAALDPTTRRDSVRELRDMIATLAVPVAVVTHSFDEAALLADRIAVLDRGRVVQEGTAGEIAARPRSAYVADFAGAAVLHGEARPEAGGLTAVALRGGGEVHSTDSASGPVAVSVFPWDVSLEPPGEERLDSALNRVRGEVASTTAIGNRVRVGVALPQSLGVEVTARSAEALGLRPGVLVTAVWKATATRLIPLGAARREADRGGR